MIIEFIGSTGAGKTTLISEVRRRLAITSEVTTSFEMVAAPLGLRGVNHPTARNLIQEFVGLPFFIRALPRHKTFVTFILRMLARQASFTIFTINNLRSLVRKIGAYEIIRRYERERIILVDEGPLLSAHNVFVYSNAVYTPQEIAKFASLVPLPDVVVYVKTRPDSLIKRSLERTDPPREMRSKNRALVETYVKRAVILFEELAKAERIRARIVNVENPDAIDQGSDTMVDYITEFILNYEPSTQPI